MNLAGGQSGSKYSLTFIRILSTSNVAVLPLPVPPSTWNLVSYENNLVHFAVSSSDYNCALALEDD